MSALAQTLRIAIRQSWKEPGFTLTVVLTPALGIGGATATRQKRFRGFESEDDG